MPELAWSHGVAQISPTAGMLSAARFLVPGGWFTPFSEAPWGPDDPAVIGMPGHLRALGGEFVCVPFGSAPGPQDAAPGWERFEGLPADRPPHGPSADEDWHIESAKDEQVVLSLTFPEDSAVERLERTIRAVPGRPALEFALTIHARRPARIPVGLHPIFRLPDAPHRLVVSAPFDTGFGYPGALAGAVVPPGLQFHDLARAGAADLSRLPPGDPVEQVVLLTGCSGPLQLGYLDEGVTVDVDWDRSVLPSVMLWISDRVLDEPPWNRSYRGVGVEPLAAAFDLPAAVSVAANPLADRGIPTAVALQPDRPLVLTYAISARPMAKV